jgi:hypothetical protein
MQILENYYIYTKDIKIYNESLDILTNILTIASQEIVNRKKILDKIFEFIKQNIGKIKTDNEIKNYIIRELKLISIVNSTKVNNLLDPSDPQNKIEIMIQNNYFDLDDTEMLSVFKGIKIKDLKKEIIEKILLNEKNVDIYNNRNVLERLSLNFNLDDLRQDINKKGINIYYKGEILEEDYNLSDYDIEKNDFLIVQTAEKKNSNKIEFEISEEKLKEGYNQINGVFSGMYDEELIKLAIKKNTGDIENTIMFLTDENNIEKLKKEIEENKKIEQQKKNNKKKIFKKEEDNIVP